MKNKNSSAQCPNKQKSGSEFCGIHAKAKNPIKIGENKLKKVKLISKSTSNSESICDTEASLAAKTALEAAALELLKLQRTVKAQAIVRGYLTRMRTRCVNCEDLYTCVSLTDIGPGHFFTFQEHEKWYGFEARTFKLLVDSGEVINPYSRLNLEPEVFVKFSRLNYQPNPQDYPKQKLTKQQLLNDTALKVFQKIDMLGNYTDYRWFMNLSTSRMRLYYHTLADTWNFRLGMSTHQKCRMVKNGVIFSIHTEEMATFHKDDVIRIILADMDRFVSEGINLEERKLGAMILLTVLTEISKDAAEALPQYAQGY